MTQRVQRRGSLSSHILERGWSRLRRIIPGLPGAVMLPMDAGARRHRLGHFAPSSWRVRGPRHAHEVAISPLLFSSPEALLETLVHEAVHAWLYATAVSSAHVGGVSVKDRYYHRREFRDACLKVGLECRYLNGRYGWTLTRWPETGVPEVYRPVLKLVAKLPLGGGNGVPAQVDGRPTPPSGQVALRCTCEPLRTIRVARRQYEPGGIVCTRCHSEFKPSATIRTHAS